MRFFKTNWLIKFYFSEFLWSKNTQKPVIYLTFDDGPIPVATEFVLDTLKKYDAKATFFCVGDNIRKYPKIFTQLLENKHSIGNHTFNHLNGWKSKNESYVDNILLCQEEIAKYQEMLNTPFFRPPYGKIKSIQFKKIKEKYKIVMWDVLTYDFDTKLDKEICLEKSIKSTRKGSIVVFHDSMKSINTLRYVLPKYLQYFKERGFVFEAL